MESIRYWRNFLRVAQHGSLSGVADEIGIAQPILSRQISRLEQTYGVRLFERHGRGMRLTPAGEILRRRAEELAARGEPATVEEVLRRQNERDRRDANRAVGPMVAADDAIEVPTDGLSPDEVLDQLEALVRSKLTQSTD